MVVVEGYLGIDNGTQGLSVILTDTSLRVIATGEGSYGFVEGLQGGCYEQRVKDWDAALATAMRSIRGGFAPADELNVLAIGISGQMHGEVLADESNTVICPVRLWCDARNEEEGHELTDALQVKIPKRATAARFLWTTRNRPDIAKRVRHVTTPAGYTAHRLTGEWNLGIGDASGMFPVDQGTLNYDLAKLAIFDTIVGNADMPSLADILPMIRKAGEDAGRLDASGAALLGLPAGIPVAAAEGDQVAALAGSLIGRPGMISCGFGTSVCANVVGDRPFVGISPQVDPYCDAQGRPLLMVWLRNGTTFLNTVVESYGGMLRTKDDGGGGDDPFARIMPQLAEAPADCGGLIALPFMDDEPGLHVGKGGSALVMGWNPDNAKAGNVAKAALLSTMFNLRLGCEVLDEQGYPRTELGLSGGLTKTPACGQILADAFNTPVTLHEAADEGSSWGAAIMAKFRHRGADYQDWPSFLDSIASDNSTGLNLKFEPDPDAVPVYEKMFQRYKKLIQLEPQLTQVMS